jgi:hypothetical protein
MSTEYEVIRAMFDSRNNRDMVDLLKTNRELRPLIENSNRVLKGLNDVNSMPLPPASKAQ